MVSCLSYLSSFQIQKANKSNRTDLTKRERERVRMPVCLCVLIYNASCQRSGMILDVMHVRNWLSRQLKSRLNRRGQITTLCVCVCAYFRLCHFPKEVNACGCTIVSLLCQTEPLYRRYSVTVCNYMGSGEVRTGRRWN